MRQMVSGLVAAAAVMTVSAAPAMACGGGLFGGCSPCGQAYVSPCAQSYAQSYAPAFNYSSGYGGGCGGCGGGVAYERLPELSPQSYYVNQGPTYSGPGNFAPLPTYQESAVSGWNAYSRPYYYGYDGGPYGNATNHYYDGANVQGPAVYSYGRRAYRPWRARTHYGYGVRPSVRYGYGVGRSYAPRYGMGYGARHYDVAPHRYGQRPLRRYY
jgi:hypothetical protein